MAMVKQTKNEAIAASKIPNFKGKWHRIAWEYFNASGTMSSFYERICEAIQTADRDNLARLRRGFPELVEYVKEGI